MPATGPSRAARATLAMAAVALAALALADYRSWRAAQRELAATLADSGLALRRPEIASSLRWETSAADARLAVARALLAGELEPGWIRALPEAQREAAALRGTARLELARTLAGEALTDLPASWAAAMVLGGSAYLPRERARDYTRFESSTDWEPALLAAHALAPAEADPVRLLAGVYLAGWAQLDGPRRDAATAILRQAFADPDFFRRLAGPWLAAAGDLDQAFALVPSTPAAWKAMLEALARRGDWPGACQARARWRDTVLADLRQRVEEGEALLAGRNPGAARDRMLRAVAGAPPDRRYAELAGRALSRCPPGLPAAEAVQGLADWIDWTVQIAAALSAPLPPRALARLERLNLPVLPQELATLALLGGDRAELERREAAFDPLLGADWAPFLVIKARTQLASGDLTAASAALQLIPRRAVGPASATLAAELAARAHDPTRLAQASQQLGEMRRRRWLPTDWRFHRGVPALEMLTPAASGLAILPARRLEHGAAVEVQWDGATVGAFPMSGEAPLQLPLAITPGVHVLRVRSIVGEEMIPGEVDLLDRPLSAAGGSPGA